MSRGNITRRGRSSWRLKYEAGEADPTTGKRATRFVTVRGTKKDAQRELTRRLAEIDEGVAVDPSHLTVAEYLRAWFDGSATGVTPKTLERYRELAERQIIPHLGATLLQKLRASQIAAWHADLLKTGSKRGKPLAARTVGHAHRVLHRGLARAVSLEIISRNVAHVAAPPKVDAPEIASLTAADMAAVLGRLADHPLHPIAALALGTGMRRGEICGLAWGAIEPLDQADGAGRAQPRRDRRRVAFQSAKDPLRPPRDQPARWRCRHHKGPSASPGRAAPGAGRPGAGDLVFTLPDGSPYAPDKLSRDWGNVVRDRGLPKVSFHGLRHSHASALIAAGLDVVTVSRRLGHGSPAITLRVYAHLFASKDTAAAEAIEAAMGGANSPT